MLGRSVRTDRHRLVEWKKAGAAPSSAEIELYDYAIDPLERKNFAHDQPGIVARLRALLGAHPDTKPKEASALPATTFK